MTFNFNVGGITPQDVNTGTGGEETTTGGILPKNIAGLVMCLDGEINSRNGVHDESINGMQNLVYAPIVSKASTTGCLEKLNGTATFSDKGIKLGGTCFYPLYQQVALTFEFTGSFDTYPFNNYGNCQRFIQTVYNGGYQIHLNNNDLVYESYNSSGTRIKYITFPMIYELGKPIHFTITDVLNVSGSTKFYINGEEVQPVFNADGTTSVCATSSTNMGIMGIHSRSAKSVYPFTYHQEGSFEGEYTYINAIRLWNRVLSPEEIKQNYLQDKKRFG